MKVMTFIGTRPEIIRLSETIKKLDKFTEHILVHTGQNYDYELNEIMFEDLGLRRPDYFLNVAGKTLGETLGNVLSKAEGVLIKEKPDAVLILGDTNSALSAIVAKRLKIPIFHLEAGNRCFDERVPEEINRKIVDHISDINVVYTQLQRDYLLNEGIPQDRIFISGSPMPEILFPIDEKIRESKVLEQYNLEEDNYFLVSYHREENTTEEGIRLFKYFLMELEDKYKLPIIVSVHPRIRKSLENFHETSLIKLCKPFGFIDYLALQTNALCVVSDSGTVSEESSILGFRAVTIRDAMERPEAINTGSIIMTSINNAIKAIEVEIGTPTYNKGVPEEYQKTNFSEVVMRIILSYTDYVNRRTWYK
jgi:UDP-N-acetylglucosamine 2-epimerase (non-hydrolysing)